MTPLELTLIGILPALGFAFGAGRIVETIKNGRYVKKEVCLAVHRAQEERWQRIDKTLDHIQDWMEAHK